MVKVSYQQKPYRRIMMESFGATVFASPTQITTYGRSVLEQDPGSPGSLGIAISEAVEAAATSNGKKKYSLGSVLNHVLTHQSVIGEEAIKQMDMANEYPDVVIGCVGGGSNFAGIAYPFLRENLLNGREPDCWRWNRLPRRLSHPACIRLTTEIAPGWRPSSRCIPLDTPSSRHPFTPVAALPRYGSKSLCPV